jgi:hypothetical protein
VRRLSFSGRAVDRMQQRGIPPSVVARALRRGGRSTGPLELPVHADADNGILVLNDQRRKTVRTLAHPGSETAVAYALATITSTVQA